MNEQMLIALHFVSICRCEPDERQVLVAMSINNDATITQLLDIGLGWDDWTLDTRQCLLRQQKYLGFFFAFGYTVDTR